MSFPALQVGVTDTPTVLVEINAAWVSHILGRLERLTQESYWEGSEAEIVQARRTAESLLFAVAKGNAVENPIGSVLMFAGGSVPDNWLFCNGQAFSIGEFPELYESIGTTYGVGAVGTFKVPDIGYRFPLGANNANAPGAVGGEASVTLTIAQMPAHAHTQTTHAHAFPIGTTVGAGTGVARAINPGTNLGTDSVAPAIQNTGGGAAHNNMPPYLVLNFIIRAR